MVVPAVARWLSRRWPVSCCPDSCPDSCPLQRRWLMLSRRWLMLSRLGGSCCLAWVAHVVSPVVPMVSRGEIEREIDSEIDSGIDSEIDSKIDSEIDCEIDCEIDDR